MPDRSTDEDALVSALIAAARLQVESETRPGAGDAELAADARMPARTAGRVAGRAGERDHGATADGAAIDVTLQGDAVLLPAEGYQQLVIDYTAGYGAAADVPADLKQAVLALVAYWYENRDLRGHDAGWARPAARQLSSGCGCERDQSRRIGTLTDRVQLKQRSTTLTRTRAARWLCSRRSPRSGRGCGR